MEKEFSKNTLRDCIYDGEAHSDGAQTCQAGEIHRCDDGTWTNLHFSCDDDIKWKDLEGGCVDFSQYVPSSGFVNPYSQDGMIFLQLDGRNPQKTVGTSDGSALSFSHAGLAISFEDSVNHVILQIGSFAGQDVIVTAYDTFGKHQTPVIVPPASGFTKVRFAGEALSLVLMVGGGNEGALSIACSYREK